MINSTGQPVVAATTISSSVFNAFSADVATGLSTTVCKDGQTVITANIPLAGFKLTGVGAATARTDAATLASIQDGTGVYVGTVGGTGDAITLTPSPAITAYATGQMFWFKAGATNTIAVTVAISGLTTKAVQINGAALVAGDITINRWYRILYDGAAFQIENVSSEVPPFTDTNALVRGSADPTKLLRFEVDGFTTGTTRVLTPPDANLTIPAVTAAGDTLYASASGVLAKLTVGANGAINYVTSNLPAWLAIGTQGQALVANVTPMPVWGVPVLRSHLAGLTMSTTGGSTTMSIAAGQAADSTNVEMMTLAAIGKTTSAWAVGTGNGGLDTGSIANSTWYHFFVIKRTDTNVVDVVFSLSASAPTMPANYTPKRRIGAGKTDGSGNWTAFLQDGDLFQWASPVSDISASNPGTSAVTRTLTVPTGINVIWLGGMIIDDSANDNSSFYGVLTDLATTDVAAGPTPAQLAGKSTSTTSDSVGTYIQVRTNTSAQIRSRLNFSTASITLYLTTFGWIDTRGRDA